MSTQTLTGPIAQIYAAHLQPGDVVAMASGTKQEIGVFKGHSKSGNCQAVFPYYGNYTKGIAYNHTARLVRVQLQDLDLATQNKLKPLIEKYKQQ
jgi:hypothetical protein